MPRTIYTSAGPMQVVYTPIPGIKGVAWPPSAKALARIAQQRHAHQLVELRAWYSAQDHHEPQGRELSEMELWLQQQERETP